MTRWLLAAVHLLALAIGFGAIVIRASAFRDILDARGIRRVLRADTWWGLAAFLWLGTGLARVFMSAEKPMDYYVASHLFWTKMGLFAVVLLLEIAPMVALIQWRMALGRGETPNTKDASRYARLSTVEAVIVALMIFVATALARGFGGVLR